MIRSVALVLKALELAAPHFPEKRAAAELLVELGRSHHFDPITMVAVVENESRWLPSAISNDGSVGLAQIRTDNYATCKGELLFTVGCEWDTKLLDWRLNLQEAAESFEAWSRYCEKKVGSDSAIYWLQGFQGYDGGRNSTCGHVQRHGKLVALPIPKLTKKVLARRRDLVERVANSLTGISQSVESRPRGTPGHPR